MKRYITLFVIIIMTITVASAALPPVRISVVNTISATGQLTIDVLSSDGATTRAIFDMGSTVATDAGGVISIVLDGTGPTTGWTTLAYNKDDLVRVTYIGVVLSIERMEVVLAKQGLFGAMIDPGEISGGTLGQVLTTNALNKPEWQNTVNNAYAYCYDNVGGEVIAGADIALNSNGVMSSNITHTPRETGITVSTTGVYKIDYGINVDASGGIEASLAIRINEGAAIESSRIYFVSAIQNYNSSVILSLNAGDIIRLNNASGVNMNRTTVGVNTHIVITKIN